MVEPLVTLSATRNCLYGRSDLQRQVASHPLPVSSVKSCATSPSQYHGASVWLFSTGTPPRTPPVHRLSAVPVGAAGGVRSVRVDPSSVKIFARHACIQCRAEPVMYGSRKYGCAVVAVKMGKLGECLTASPFANRTLRTAVQAPSGNSCGIASAATPYLPTVGTVTTLIPPAPVAARTSRPTRHAPAPPACRPRTSPPIPRSGRRRGGRAQPRPAPPTDTS